MAIRSLITTTLTGSGRFQFEFRNHMSSRTFPISSTTNQQFRRENPSALQNEILRLQKYPVGSATAVLQNWTDNGGMLSASSLRHIANRLIKCKSYHFALQIMEWMGTQKNFCASPVDYATRVELIGKVHGLKEAEEYFKCGDIHNAASQKAAFLPLLRGYVRARDVDKAEALMKVVSDLGLIVEAHPFNEMMKLYNAVSRYEQVPLVILEMNRNKIPRNTLSYNLWMSACGEMGQVAKAESVYKEMVADENVNIGWSSLVTLANVYLKGGFLEKAHYAIGCAEKKLSVNGQLGYSFVMTMFSLVKNREGIVRVWEASKHAHTGGRMTCANYICVLSCLIKVGDIEGAERVFREWENNCRNYDIRVSNVLLGAYARSGRMDKAEFLHLRTLERGGHPNYKTWEILTEGWIRSQNMEKAFDAIKKGFAVLKQSHWRPSHDVLMAIANYIKGNGTFEDANHFAKAVHHLGVASLPLYKTLLTVHLYAQTPAFDVIKMMEKDKIEMDDEARALVQVLQSDT